MCTLMFVTALLMVVRKWRQPSCPSPDEGTMKLRAIYTLALYSAVKKIKVVEFEGKWAELEKVLHATDYTDPITGTGSRVTFKANKSLEHIPDTNSLREKERFVISIIAVVTVGGCGVWVSEDSVRSRLCPFTLPLFQRLN